MIKALFTLALAYLALSLLPSDEPERVTRCPPKRKPRRKAAR